MAFACVFLSWCLCFLTGVCVFELALMLWLLRLCCDFCVCVFELAFVFCTYGPPYIYFTNRDCAYFKTTTPLLSN